MLKARSKTWINSIVVILHFGFRNNSLVANPSKFQILFLGKKNSSMLFLEINGRMVYASNAVRLLGVTIDDKLYFLPRM